MELQELRGEVVKVEDVITLVASEYAGLEVHGVSPLSVPTDYLIQII